MKNGFNISKSFISHSSNQYQLRFLCRCISYCSLCMQTTQLWAAVLPCEGGAWLDQTVSPADLRGWVTERCFNVRHWHTVLWRQWTEHTDKRLQIRFCCSGAAVSSTSKMVANVLFMLFLGSLILCALIFVWTTSHTTWLRNLLFSGGWGYWGALGTMSGLSAKRKSIKLLLLLLVFTFFTCRHFFLQF